MQTGERGLSQDTHLPEVMPVIPLLSGVVFPLGTETVQIRIERNRRLIQEVPPDEPILLTYLKDSDGDLSPENMLGIGVVGRLVSKLNLPGDVLQVVFQGIRRVRYVQMVEVDPFYRAEVSGVNENPGDIGAVSRLLVDALNAFSKLMEINRYYQEEELNVLKMNTEDPGIFSDLICLYLNLSYDERKLVINTPDHPERLALAVRYIEETIQRAIIGKETTDRTQVVIEEGQREFYLRQQLQTIKQMLGEGDEQEAEIKALEDHMKRARLEGDIRETVEAQLDRLRLLAPVSQEYQVTHNYIDQILDVPWNVETQSDVDIQTVRDVLDQDHYGLEEAKERIIEIMAVAKFTGNMTGPILCFVGPPGTGKTSLGQSIARAVDRKFIRMSVGGVRDEAEIRGHRRTYVGAMPGKIIQSLQRIGACNPVLMIDEIDKMGAHPITGDLASAMLEVLDPEQNTSFTDHYLSLPFDLSRVLFVATANTLYDIPEPLRDRMEVIAIPGYTEEEKLEISRRHLIPKLMKQHGLDDQPLQITDETVLRIIREYTREPGLRNFGRRLETVIRKIAVMRSSGDEAPAHIELDNLPDYLGPPLFIPTTEDRSPEVGVVNGLGVTGSGGQLLMIEALRIPGNGQLIITGQLGEVMRESVLAAKSYIQSQAGTLNIPPEKFDKYNIHLHFPEGAIPKDGPSAGIAIATAIASLLSDRPVRTDIAMTGEITLRGRVLAVGGIKDKVLAAHRAGIKTVLVPKQNENDLANIPDTVRDNICCIPVESIDEVLKESFIDVVVPQDTSIERIVQAERERSAAKEQSE
ncbi:MAG: endopeptidase La [Gemmatimonadota bacterium]|nr:endopeptidase La [Gemmatimonadota bacterium]